MQVSFDNTEIAFSYKSDSALKKAQLLFTVMGSPAFSKAGMALASWGLKLKLPIKWAIKNTVFSQFCGGETLEEAAQRAAMLHQFNIDVALDYGVEGKASEADFDNAVPEFVRAIEYAASKQNIIFIPIKVTGFARFALLEKIHAKQALTASEQQEWQNVMKRIETICNAAFNNNVMILIDAEESWIQDPIDDIANLMMQHYNKQKPIVFNTFQMYLHTSMPYLKKSFDLAKNGGYILGAKIVRGAYMEKERNRAAEMNYLSPVQPNKAATDKDYDEAVQLCLDRNDYVATFVGTHNELSCYKAIELMQQKGLNTNNKHVFFSQLFGMSDNITFNLANAGYNVSKYLPYGPVKDVMPYLIRRAQENTSVAGQTGRELTLLKKEAKRRKG